MRRPVVRLALVAAALFGCARSGLDPTPLPVCGSRPCAWAALEKTVDSAVTDGAAPGAVVAVSYRGARYYHGAGRLGLELERRPGPTTVYDLASVTKVVALTTLAMFAVDDGKLDLDAPVASYLPRFGGGEKDRVTIRHLLTHSSGLRAHRALWQEATSPDSAIGLVLATPLDTVPGVTTVYSDLGAILLTQVIQSIYRDPIDRLAAARIFGPLGLRSTRYRPPESWRSRIAPTERDPWRGRIVWGEVHDENAAFLGGVSGHAGLFSDAIDLLGFGEWLLRQVGDSSSHRRAGEPVVSRDVARAFTRAQNVVPGSSRALGWDTPSLNSSAGTRLSEQSFGHTGFTGTSIWIDPTRSLVVVLLSNRVHPTRDNPRLGPLRALVADRVAGLVDGTP